MNKKMQIRIYPDGTVAAHTVGVKGSACTDYIDTIELLLDSRVVESAYTDEFYLTELLQTEQIDPLITGQ